MKLNKKQIDYIKGAEEYFHQAVKANYKRVSPRELDDRVAEVYKEATGKEYPLNSSCGACIYNLYLQVGRMYFESLKVTDEPEPILKTNELNNNSHKKGLSDERKASKATKASKAKGHKQTKET